MKCQYETNIGCKYLKFFFPLISFIVSSIAVLLIGSLPPELGAALIAINIIVLWVCLFIPPLSFVYSKVILKNSNKRALYTLLNSFAACLPSAIYAVIMLPSRLRIRYALIYMLVIFAWSEIWGLLGLIGKRDKNNSEKQSDVINDKTYSHLLYPIISFILSFCIECIAFIPKSDFYHLIVNTILLAWILLFMPIASFLYSKIILKSSRNKIIYSLLNSLAICLSYLFLLFLELHSYWFAIGIFAWSTIWGLLGLIGKRDKKENEISEEQ